MSKSSLSRKYRMMLWVLAGICFGGCHQEKAPLDQQQFTSLLIDMHTADGILSQNRMYTAEAERRNYMYYNDIFEKYGINKAVFDSCMYFYTARPLVFSKIYEVVIDTLNKRLTEKSRILQVLQANDSVNYFPGPDTLIFDQENKMREFVLDSLQKGLYKFSTTLRFDTIDAGINNHIAAFFVSGDGEDTLYVRDVRVYTDTIARHYAWSQYVDSSYTRLVLRFPDADNLEKLRYRKGKAWETTLFRPYTPANTEKKLENVLPSPKKEKRKVKQIDDPIDKAQLRKRKQVKK